MTWTISTLLDWTTIYFTNHKIEEPHLEAEILLAHALKIKRIELYMQHERVLKEEELAAFKQMILRRIKREPTAYIIGYKPFMSLDLNVTKDVLIPRPETEKLVEESISLVKLTGKDIVHVADIGTGSGAIGVSVAKYCKSAKVYATDISKAAIGVAESNAEKHGVKERISFYLGDLFSPIPEGIKFDLILSNPPYIKTSEIKDLQPEISKYEPAGALDGGSDGLDYYKRIVSQAPAYLADSGYLLLEAGYGQAESIIETIKNTGAFRETKKIKDLSGIDRVILAKI